MNLFTTFLTTCVLAPVLAQSASAASRLFVSAGMNLTELDPLTGAVIGNTPITGMGGTLGAFAYDPATQTLFASNTGSDDLWTVNTTTGAATLVGPYNVGTTVVMHGLAIDDTGQLYGYSTNAASAARFFRVNRMTGAATPIADPGIGGFGSLEFVPSTSTMYFADTVGDQLYTIDRTTGVLTLVGPFGVAGSVGIGLAYDPVLGMYGCNNSTVQGLFRINLATGAATFVAALANNPLALVFIPDPNTPSTSFCSGDGVGTACLGCGNNGSAGRGCANSSFAAGTLLASTGIASLAADTLVLTASDIPGPGLFFQADSLAANPVTFGDGMLCAAVGIIRMGVVFPTPAFTASYPGGLTPNPIHVAGAPINPGDTKHYQCWYRDAAAFCTPATFNTSNGISLPWAP